MDSRLWRKSVYHCQIAFGTCFSLNASATWTGGKKKTYKVEVLIDPSRVLLAEGSLGRWLHWGTLETIRRCGMLLGVPKHFCIHLKRQFCSVSVLAFIPLLRFTGMAIPEHHFMLYVWTASMASWTWPWPGGSSKHWKQAIPVWTYVE